MNDLYMKLGRAMATKCQPGFYQAALLADMEKEGADLKLTYSKDEGGEWEPALTDDERARAARRADRSPPCPGPARTARSGRPAPWC